MKRKEVWHPVQFNSSAAYTLQAMARGEDTQGHQNKLLIDWLLNDLCQTYEEVFSPDNARVSDYLAGRRSVGLGITKHLNIRPDAVTGRKTET